MNELTHFIKSIPCANKKSYVVVCRFDIEVGNAFSVEEQTKRIDSAFFLANTKLCAFCRRLIKEVRHESRQERLTQKPPGELWTETK